MEGEGCNPPSACLWFGRRPPDLVGSFPARHWHRRGSIPRPPRGPPGSSSGQRPRRPLDPLRGVEFRICGPDPAEPSHPAMEGGWEGTQTHRTIQSWPRYPGEWHRAPLTDRWVPAVVVVGVGGKVYGDGHDCDRNEGPISHHRHRRSHRRRDGACMAQIETATTAKEDVRSGNIPRNNLCHHPQYSSHPRGCDCDEPAPPFVGGASPSSRPHRCAGCCDHHLGIDHATRSGTESESDSGSGSAPGYSCDDDCHCSSSGSGSGSDCSICPCTCLPPLLRGDARTRSRVAKEGAGAARAVPCAGEDDSSAPSPCRRWLDRRRCRCHLHLYCCWDCSICRYCGGYQHYWI